MNEYKYEIKVKADGYWVGYRDKNGEWQDADNEPYDSFIDAVKYRDFIEERERQPVSRLAEIVVLSVWQDLKCPPCLLI